MARVFDNDFRQWKITPEQISRIKNGEVQAMTEVFTDNYDRIKKMACKFYWLKKKLGYQFFYEIDDLVNQVFADMQYYYYRNALSMFMDIKASFLRIGIGGFKVGYHKNTKSISLDTPIKPNENDSPTIGDFLASNLPDPLEQMIKEEDEINSMEKIVQTVVKTFARVKISQRRREIYTAEIIEDIFRGYTYETVKGRINNAA